MRPPPVSHQRALALGWTRVDPRPWRKTTARWLHVDGWEIQHCGHPTALWPWALYDAAGLMHCTGGLARFDRKPENGTAWPSLLEAMEYVHDPAPRGDPSRRLPPGTTYR